MARTHMSDTVFALAWCLFAATCVGQPQKMWPVGAVDPSVTKALHLAVEAHVRELQPQARATEERAARLPAYHKEKLTGAHPLTYDAGKLREVVKRSLGPQTSDERERRAEEQQTHSRSAAAQLKSYAFTGSVAVLTSQSELFQTVLRDKDVWMVAFINGEKDAAILPIIDMTSKRLSGQVRVAVIDYVAADWDLRSAWTVTPRNVPQLRLFSTRGELPAAISGLEKTKGPMTFANLTTAQHAMRSQMLASECMQRVRGNKLGEGARLRGYVARTEL